MWGRWVCDGYLVCLDLSEDLPQQRCQKSLLLCLELALVASSQFVCVGAWDFWGASYWTDTLVLKTEGNTYATLYCITLSSSRKTNASSRRSKKDFWRHCRGGLCSSQDIPSTHHKLISLAFTLFAICLSFSSPPLHPCRFIRPLFPNLDRKSVV